MLSDVNVNNPKIRLRRVKIRCQVSVDETKLFRGKANYRSTSVNFIINSALNDSRHPLPL